MIDLDHTSIVNIVMDATVERLVQRLRVQVDDGAKAGLIRAGRLQDDPTNKKINVLIHPGGSDYPDEINTNTSPSAGMFVPGTYTIGGGYGSVFWRRYIQIEFQVFFSNESSRNTARTKAQVVMSRTHNALLTWDIGRETVKDSFGEKAYDKQVIKAYMDEGGGDGDWNWRGFIVLEYLTEIEPIDP